MQTIENRLFVLLGWSDDIRNIADLSIHPHIDKNKFTFKNCTFNINSDFILSAGNIDTIVFDNCTFNVQDNASLFLACPESRIEYKDNTFNVKTSFRIDLVSLKTIFHNTEYRDQNRSVKFLCASNVTIDTYFDVKVEVKEGHSLTIKDVEGSELPSAIVDTLLASYCKNYTFKKCTLSIEDLQRYLYRTYSYSFDYCTLTGTYDKELDYEVHSLYFYKCTFECDMKFLSCLRYAVRVRLIYSYLLHNSIPFINADSVDIQNNETTDDTLHLYHTDTYYKVPSQSLYIDANTITFSDRYFDECDTNVLVTINHYDKPLRLISKSTLVSNKSLSIRVLIDKQNQLDSSELDTSKVNMFFSSVLGDGVNEDTIHHLTSRQGEHYISCGYILKKVTSKQGNIYRLEKAKSIPTDERYYYLYEYAPNLGKHFDTLEDIQEYINDIDRINKTLDDFDLTQPLSREDAISLYKTVTGSCTPGVDKFLSNHPELDNKSTFTLEEIIDLTKGEYGHTIFKQAISRKYDVTFD